MVVYGHDLSTIAVHSSWARWYLGPPSSLLQPNFAIFKRYDRVNYARWGTIYLLESSEFQRGNFVVKRSTKAFNQVNSDQAMERISSTGKKCGGIIGITKTTSAVCRWSLSYNLRSHIAYPTHTMYNLCLGNSHLHNEATTSRKKRGKDDESALLSTLQRFKVFSIFFHTWRLWKNLPLKT